MNVDIEQVYHSYLQKEQDENQKKYDKYAGWYGASSAGSCYRKQLHKARGDEKNELKPRNMRLLRLGTIVHNDLELAMNNYIENEKPEHIKVIVEHRIEIPDLNVLGHLDLCVYEDNDGELRNVEVWDYKTAGSYKWRLKYGRGAVNKIDRRYAMQVSTYAMGICNELQTQSATMGLLWYNKDTSSLRKEFIPDIYIDDAYEYWTELNEVADEVQEPEDLQVGDVGVPFENWECRYCEYQGKYCEGLTR